jgi:hypothetical protein
MGAVSGLEFFDLALQPASGIAECLNAAGIDGSLSSPGVAPAHAAESIDPALE